MQFDQLKRRGFITLLGGAAVSWPLSARAQQPAMPIVGVLDSVGSPTVLPAFRDGLTETGYVAGRNVALDVRSTDNYDRLPELARDLAYGRVAAIAALGGPSAPPAKAASTTIPIVFSIGGDPVELGLVDNIRRPGRNITGVTFFTAQLLQKQIGLMHELLPKAHAFGLLVNPENPRAQADLGNAQAAARSLNIDLHIANASAKREFESAFATFQQKHVAAIIIPGDPLVFRESSSLAMLTSRYAMPAIMGAGTFARSGGLLGYGASVTDAYRQAGTYVGRILKGERPGELPVLQPTKFELVINLKTAKAMGLAMPATLLALADEVIE
jgi:putative tryptophan/tyrosine transport system substrate-binding protein